MAILEVPGSFPTIAAALAAANPGDTINLAAGYGPEVVTVTVSNITITGPVDATGIEVTIGAGVTGLTLTGDAPINVTDSAGGDVITGNDGDNIITVTGGADTVDGGLGVDRLVVDYSAFTGINTVTATSITGSSGGSVTYTGFENLTILTGAGADTITLTTGDNIIEAGEAINTIVSGDGNNTVTSGAGADVITLGTGNNYLDAGDGVNIVIVGPTGIGDNTIIAGDGADSITVGLGNNAVDAGDGANIVIVGPTGFGNNTILTGIGADTITTGNGDNFICVGEGINIVTAGSGNNLILAGDGADTITASGGNNVIEAGGGANIITTTAGNDVIEVGNAADTVATGAGDDIIKDLGGAGGITAGAGHDRIIMDLSAATAPLSNTLTGAGPDYGGVFAGTTYTGVEEFHITGGSGDDVFTTGIGADVLDGGAGADTLSAGGGNDVIYGGVGDVIAGGEDVDGLDFDVLVLDGPGTVTFDAGSTEDGSVLLDSGGTVTFTGIEHIVFGATTITTPEDTPLVGNLGVTVATFEVGNISFTAGDTASRTEGDLTINADGTYTFTPAPNYNGPAPVINYTDSAGVTSPLFIEVLPVVDPCILPPICFVQGSFIATGNGEIPIENLKVGDLIQTLDHGLQPLRWIGRRHLSAVDLAENENMRPIRIHKDVIGAGNGAGDLVVSPQHRILIASKVVQRMFDKKEVLVAAKQLLAIDGVDIAYDFEVVTYFHILFDQHEIVFANGCPSESLYLGKEALNSLSADGRKEICKLFPEVASPTFMATSCRPFIQNKKARELALCHKKNRKSFLDIRFRFQEKTLHVAL